MDEQEEAQWWAEWWNGLRDGSDGEQPVEPAGGQPVEAGPEQPVEQHVPHPIAQPNAQPVGRPHSLFLIAFNCVRLFEVKYNQILIEDIR